MYTVRQFYEIICSQRLTEEVCTQYRMTNREQPNELQLDVYVRARMRIPVAMETVVCLPFSSMGEQVETADLLSEMMHWLAHWWGCQTYPRTHCPTTLTSCQTPGILPEVGRDFSWMREPGHMKRAGICWTHWHDCSETAICIKMKGLLSHS